MKSAPLVSVIIPTYNREQKVLKAIESVLNQRYQNIQLIVVDDGSRDNTQALISEMDGLEYIYQENQGQAAARNTGLKRAAGTLIASLDSDDYWTESFIENCVAALEERELDFVFANWHQAIKSGEWIDFLSQDPFLKPFLKNEQWIVLSDVELRRLYLQACPSPSSSLVFRRSSLVSGWNERLNIGDDWCLYLDMILAKPCRAAFTLQKLWYKGIDDINIYDGRAWNDVVKFLLVDDTKILMDRYRLLLTKAEWSVLEKRYINGLVELSKHHVLRERNLPDATKLMLEAISLNVAQTLIAVPKVIYSGLSNHARMIRNRCKSNDLASTTI